MTSKSLAQWQAAFMDTDFECARYVWKCTNIERDDYAKCYMLAIVGTNVHQQAIKVLIGQDIDETIDHNTIFRGNTIAIKVVDQYLKLIGAQYLKQALKPLIDIVYQMNESCDIDVSKCETPQIASRNAEKILICLNLFWKKLQSSVSTIPIEFFMLFSQIKAKTIAKFPENQEVKYGAVRYFLIYF